MKRNASILLVFSAVAVAGYLAIFTIPYRKPAEPAPEMVTTTDIDIDKFLMEKEEEAEERKLILDSMLETAEVVRKPQILQILSETATESEEWYILPSEEETSVFEAYTGFEPVDCMMDSELQEWLFEYCEEADLDPYVIIAMCELESCCTPDIMGDSGKSYGIMQIQIRWIPDRLEAHGYTASDMLEAKPNIIIGTEILKTYLDMGHGLEWALMAYNGGIPAVGSPDTVFYASWILERSTALREASEGRASNGEA